MENIDLYKYLTSFTPEDVRGKYMTISGNLMIHVQEVLLPILMKENKGVRLELGKKYMNSLGDTITPMVKDSYNGRSYFICFKYNEKDSSYSSLRFYEDTGESVNDLFGKEMNITHEI